MCALYTERLMCLSVVSGSGTQQCAAVITCIYRKVINDNEHSRVNFNQYDGTMTKMGEKALPTPSLSGVSEHFGNRSGNEHGNSLTQG